MNFNFNDWIAAVLLPHLSLEQRNSALIQLFRQQTLVLITILMLTFSLPEINKILYYGLQISFLGTFFLLYSILYLTPSVASSYAVPTLSVIGSIVSLYITWGTYYVIAAILCCCVLLFLGALWFIYAEAIFIIKDGLITSLAKELVRKFRISNI